MGWGFENTVGNNTPDTLVREARDEIARRYLDSAENWLRKLAHYKLGGERADYITGGKWKKDRMNAAVSKLTKYPDKYKRQIDSTTFEQLIYIVCHPEYWKDNFHPALQSAYPLGAEEARIFLERLKDIRNDVSHGQSCSARQLERAICYSNDVSDSIKLFFRDINMGQEYDVPMFTKYSDNAGNSSNFEGISVEINNRILDLRKSQTGDLRPGDTLVAQIEVDQSYDRSGYNVFWRGFGFRDIEGNIASIAIGNAHVGVQVELVFRVITHRDWHRQHGVDDQIIIVYRVLPPI